MSLIFIGHPSESDLALFAGGELGPLVRWRIERHLQTCDHCQEAVADFFHLQSELSELAALPPVDWESLGQQITERISAPPPVAEPPRLLFPRPLVWRLGLATATLLCAFVVVRQLPMLDSLKVSDGPLAGQPAVEMEEGQAVSALQSDGAESRQAAPLAETESMPVDSLEQAGQTARLKESNALANKRAPTASHFRAETKSEGIEGQVQKDFRFGNEQVLRDQMFLVPDESAAAAAPESQDLRLAKKGAVDRPNLRVRRAAVSAGPSDDETLKATGAGSRAVQETAILESVQKREGALKQVAKAMEADLDALASREPPPVPPPPTERAVSVGALALLQSEKAKAPARKAGQTEPAERVQALAVSGNLAREQFEESRRQDKPGAHRPESEPRRGFSVLPAALEDPNTDVGVAADGWMSIRSLDARTGTITITDVYLP